mmetsp:Transcript_19360/g.26662  ORF Transcript_19360/g.26662 Transcript_19360/m.26662 type:complete len:99 (-) Transcript_19360:65-361(-)
MTRVVKPPLAWSPSSACCTSRSLSLSSAEVASSSSRIAGRPSTARAIAIRCFCPPESSALFSPTSVAYPSWKPSTKSWALADLAAAMICSSVDSSRLP